MHKLNKIFFTLIIQISCLPIFAQQVDYYHDFNVDYFPRITVHQFDPKFGGQPQYGELIETLTNITRYILGEYKYLERMSGFVMMSSGICPPQIRNAEKWIKIEIDKKGHLNNVEVYQHAVQRNHLLSEQYSKILQAATFHPALKSMEPVNIRLYYIVKSNP